MISVSIEEMQRDLRGYLNRVQSGEIITIVQADQPVAELKPVTPAAKTLRPIGLYEGEFVVPDNFDDPLPEEIEALRAGNGRDTDPRRDRGAL